MLVASRLPGRTAEENPILSTFLHKCLLAQLQIVTKVWLLKLTETINPKTGEGTLPGAMGAWHPKTPKLPVLGQGPGSCRGQGLQWGLLDPLWDRGAARPIRVVAALRSLPAFVPMGHLTKHYTSLIPVLKAPSQKMSTGMVFKQKAIKRP